MLTIFQTEDTVKFVFYTLGITDDMMNKKEAGNIATKTILNLIKSGKYSRTKERLLPIINTHEVNLQTDEFFTFCVLIDFTARCFVSDIFSDRLKTIHERHPLDTSATFDEMKDFYLRYATKYFDDIKSLYKNEKWVGDIIKQSTDWIMNDEEFRRTSD